jgi:phenylalanyl-tRNA synthetase beta chain
LVYKSVTFSQLRATAFATEKKLLKSVALFDVYEGDKLPEGKKSYALSFILEDKNQTLNDKTIERTMSALQSAFEQKHGAQIR